MGVRLRFRGNVLAGKIWEFDDDVQHIVVGRDSGNCQVVVPEEMREVGRQHFGLRRELGRYRLVLNRDNPVYVDGKQAVDGMELPPAADVRLGKEGPRLTIMTLMGDDALQTVRHEKAGPGIRTRIERAEGSSRRNVRMLGGITALVVVLGVAGWLVFGKQGEKIDEFGKKIDGVLSQADSRLGSEMKRYEEELATLKGSMGAEREKIARLVVEREARAKLLEDMKRRQDLSDAERKSLEGKLKAQLDEAEKKLGQLNDKVAKQPTAGGGVDWAEVARRYEHGIFLVAADISFAVPLVDPFTNRPRKDKDGNAMVQWKTTTGIGTGFCIREDGLIATNAHVVEMLEESDTQKVHNRVVFQNVTGHGYKITRWARHPGYKPLPGGRVLPCPDIGLIQVEGLGGPGGVPAHPGQTVSVFKLADEATLRKLAVGSPIGTMGFPGEMRERYLDEEVGVKGARKLQVAGSYATFKSGFIARMISYDQGDRTFEHAFQIQHSAILSPGTSGSPLFNADGYVVGIHNSNLAGTGALLFGIRADEIASYWTQLRQDHPGDGW